MNENFRHIKRIKRQSTKDITQQINSHEVTPRYYRHVYTPQQQWNETEASPVPREDVSLSSLALFTTYRSPTDTHSHSYVYFIFTKIHSYSNNNSISFPRVIAPHLTKQKEKKAIEACPLGPEYFKPLSRKNVAGILHRRKGGARASELWRKGEKLCTRAARGEIIQEY